MAEAWDRQPNESEAAYARFLAYRNLGPARSLDAAYRVTKGDESLQAPGSWAQESARFEWVRRASEWDIHNLLTQSERAATLYASAVERYAEKVLNSLGDVEFKDGDSLTRAIDLLAKLFPGDSLAALVASRAERPGDSGRT